MLKNLKAIEDERIVAKCYVELGDVTKEKGEYDESLRYHRKSMEIFERIADALSVADSHLNIAAVYKAKGELKEAMSEYEKGLALYEDVVVDDAFKNSDSVLPAAHDALTARIIERAGFQAYQIGGFALNGARHAYPDLVLTHFGEERTGFYDIIVASSLPVMIEADHCYGDVKNVTRTIRGYEALGVSALFFEDQRAPKRCDHLQELVSVNAIVSIIRAALAACSESEFFIIARTNAIEAYDFDEALRRGERYLQVDADGLFIESSRNVEQIERIGRYFKGASLCVNIFKGGDRTPWVSPDELHKMKFSMILYPTTILFRVMHTIEQAVRDLKAEKQL
ncbi:unnamed protein product [Rotaria sp. Silwood1]|nr:unnamed protein product [Rotaria sp. Silwood1]CAF1286801.1 unnamed protein product [Rotaria sp. Silwood1]CAF3511902.1 unnamed protein product [Rotaria sp. Silwood1]CAF4571738.1 unnamed protein product [Rotaria sp. Silwood1]